MVTAVITAVFEVAQAVITGLGTLIASAFGLLYTSGASPAITELGYLVMILIGAPLAYAVLMWVVGLFRRIKVFGGGKR